MPLSAGTRLGPYEILTPLGAGGMGEVYKARDPRLQRDVAIKIITKVDPDRLRRFETEARAASALNHPNIVSVYDVGEVDGVPYIVSELIDGEPLGGAGMPLRTLLDIAVQIADGLAAAHQVNLVHRDVKPDNIMVTRDQRVKILDFGLAKSTAPSPDSDTTRTVTQGGVLLGTLAYMSPEQVRGVPLDPRSDQFSFGVVLYELAVGKRPFAGPTSAELLSAILRDDPEPIASQNPKIPAPLRWIIERCLAKEPQGRFASTTDLYRDLRHLRDHLSEAVTVEIAPAPTPPPAGRRIPPALLAVAGVLVGSGLMYFLLLPQNPGPSTYRYTPFATEAGLESSPAWSPDGKTLAFSAEVNGIAQVLTRSLDAPSPTQLTRCASNCGRPFWAPDGSRVYYHLQTDLWSVGAAGGASQLVMKGVGAVALSPDGKGVVYQKFTSTANESELWIGSFPGSDTHHYQEAPFPAHFISGSGIEFSPDGRKIAIHVLPTGEPSARGPAFYIVPFRGGKPLKSIPLQATVWGLSWMPDNRHLITSFAAGESSLSSTEQATVSLYSLDSAGGTLRRITAGTTEEYYPSVAPNGTNIAFSLVLQDSDLLEVPVEGGEVRPLLATARNEREPAWARSGTQYAYVTDAHGPVEIWLRNPVEGSARALIRDTDIQGESAFRVGLSSPQFSPDGLRIAYLGRGKVWVSPVAGGQPVAVDAPRGLVSASSPVWTPDGNWIVYIRGFGPRWVITKIPSGGGGSSSELASGVGAAGVDCSPTGEWLCYRRTDGLHLMTLDGTQDHVLNRTTPVVFGFSKDGAKIHAIRRGAGRTWERVLIDIRTGAESNLAELNVPASATLRGFSLHPDGKRFATTIGTTRSDIWILGGFSLPRGGFAARWPIER